MSSNQTHGQWVRQQILRGLIALVVAAALIYLGDWAVWRIRNATSKDGRGGLDTVTISRFVVAPLKGNKEEYYFDGKGPADCSRTLFPQAGAGACWYLRRHPVQFDR
jgi:hypothetical protein